MRLTKVDTRTGITKTQDFSSGGVIREYDVEIDGFIEHHKIVFSNHRPFNKKVYIHAKNVRDVLNNTNAKSILFNNQKIPLEDFLALYGRKVMAVDYDGNFYHNNIDKFVIDGKILSLVYPKKYKVFEDIISDYLKEEK